MMRILAVGGGSGGHVTPVVAVLREIRKERPQAEIRFWCDKKFVKQASELVGHFDDKIPVQTILAGKLRRYHHLTVLRQLLWPSLVLRNIRDMFLVVAGFFQSFFKLIVWRPDVVFTKGGYVCLPVGVAAYLLRIPLVVHDSDAHPGLTNRILGKWATAIATGAPLEHYNYPIERSRYVGIPIAAEYHKFSKKEQTAAKEKWGIAMNRPLVVVTGGGLGASRINDAIVLTLEKLLKLTSVVLISGEGQYDELVQITPANNKNFQLYPFISDNFASLLGAADVVIARAGATTILELASLAKPTILIPNAKLSGGHQLKNAEVYQKSKATVVVNEDDLIENPNIIVDVVDKVLADKTSTEKMTRIFSSFARPNASREVAGMIISSAKHK
jgi:UDP-N-acetylglucosamine--N-acetylmuramyl-(pentapeptide) pyrophosphoryl-undecaprenol N-acetylglucosamine transferase